jgi:predicted nuclease of predicted toxin-antitoxin system
VKFLVDNQLPAALAHFLRKRGLECQHVLEVGFAEASDSETCRYALEHGRVIVTKDEDFLYLAGLPKSEIKLLWVRLGNCRTKALLAAIERIWPKIEAGLMAGERIIEIR